jgi:ankyrin repeat protein
MHDAVRTGDVTAIEVLLAGGESADVVDEQSGWSALMLAAENQQLQASQALLDAGADPNYAMPDGWTALHHAVDSECDGQSQTGAPTDGRFSALLVSAGARVDAVWTRDGQSLTPIDIATRYQCDPVSNVLRQ